MDLPPSQTAQVTLPVVLGVRPIQYVPVIYAAAVVLFLFFLLVFPNLVAPGARVTIISQPPNAAVFFGDTAYGSTPVEVFVPAGATRLTLKRPGFPDYTQNITIPNNPVLGLIFPARVQVEATMVPGDSYAIMTRFQRLLSEYSLSAPFEENRQPPPLFTEVLGDLSAAGLSLEEISSYVIRFLPFVADYYLYRNLRVALSGSEPGTLTEERNFWRSRLSTEQTPFFDAWLFSVRPLGEKNALIREGYFGSLKASLSLRGDAPTLRASPVAGFSELSEGLYLFGPQLENPPIEDPWEYPYMSKLSRVLIQQRLVTQGEYARFIAANPEWAPQNRSDLETRGWADSRYLEDWIDNSPARPNAPVVNIGYDAALAYASWYRAPNGWKARLPYDPEWEAAAKAGLAESNLEWMQNAWAPGEFLLRSAQQPWEKAPAGMAPSVRGTTEFNWGQDAMARRATMPRQSSSPILGFRLVLEAQ